MMVLPVVLTMSMLHEAAPEFMDMAPPPFDMSVKPAAEHDEAVSPPLLQNRHYADVLPAEPQPSHMTGVIALLRPLRPYELARWQSL